MDGGGVERWKVWVAVTEWGVGGLPVCGSLRTSVVLRAGGGWCVEGV